MKGLVKPGCRRNKIKQEVSGIISRISTEIIHVPLKHRKALDDILAQDKQRNNESRQNRYEVELAYGSCFEPWIASVKYLADKPKVLNDHIKQ